MNDASVKSLKKAIKGIIKGTDQEVEAWMDTKHPYLGDKKPNDLIKTPEGFRKLEILVSFCFPDGL